MPSPRVPAVVDGADRHLGDAVAFSHHALLLVAARAGELAQERVAARALVDDRGVAEADVHGARPLDSVDRLLQNVDAVGPGGLGPRLHVRLVDLDDVRPGREQIDDLLADRPRIAGADGVG
jgi:hypothetical protein